MREAGSTDDHFFKEIMAKSRLDLPFSDFEDNVMIRIENKVAHQNSFSKEIKLSWIFFIAGSIFGIIISFILPELKRPVLGISPASLTLVFQITFACLLFTQIDTLLKFSRKDFFKETIK